VIQRRGSAERSDLFGYQESVVQPVAIVAVAVGLLVVVAAAAAVVLLAAVPEAAAAAVAAGTGCSFAPCDIAPIQDFGSKVPHLPCRQR
jgi:hypothetical protein